MTKTSMNSDACAGPAEHLPAGAPVQALSAEAGAAGAAPAIDSRILPALGIVGRLSFDRADELGPLLLDHAARGAAVDLSAVDLLDSTGLQLLLLAARNARAHGRTLHLTGVGHAVRELAARFGLAAELGLAPQVVPGVRAARRCQPFPRA